MRMVILGLMVVFVLLMGWAILPILSPPLKK
jgi:hypothetical protein